MDFWQRLLRLEELVTTYYSFKKVWDYAVCVLTKNYTIKNHRTLIWILGAFMLMLSPVKGQYFEFVQITDNAYDQKLPAIDGDYIVYEDYRNGSNSDIYLYNRLKHTEIPLASDPGVSSIQPDISGNIVVWADNRDGDYQIYWYDINSPETDPRVISLQGSCTQPSVHGDRMVLSLYKYSIQQENSYGIKIG